MVDILRYQVPFDEAPSPREPVGINEKIRQSAQLLSTYVRDPELQGILFQGGERLEQYYALGILPRITPFDAPPDNFELVKIPEQDLAEQRKNRSHDLIQWNTPDVFLQRLQKQNDPFVPPEKGNSTVMAFLNANKIGVSFSDLRIESSPPNGRPRERRTVNYTTQETKIMGRHRIPFALGSVPDVGSALAYDTIAKAGGLALISRDKILSDPDKQAFLARTVIDHLRSVPLPPKLVPNTLQLEQFRSIQNLNPGISSEDTLSLYVNELRQSWIDNIGAAVEASPKALIRAQKLYEAGCRMFRVYSPEGGREIIDTVKLLRKEFGNDIKIIAGQVMHVDTAKEAEESADAVMIGVAGGSQCTTSVNADIPVNTPNLLYALRGEIQIPIGIEGGGVDTHVPDALTLGASFLCKPGEIGRSYEGAGGIYMFQNKQTGEDYFIYGGEASDAAKWWRDDMDDLGRTKFVEGASGKRHLPKENRFMTGNIHRLREQIAVALVFQRARTVSDLHRGDCSNIWRMTPAASGLSQAYQRDNLNA